MFPFVARRSVSVTDVAPLVTMTALVRGTYARSLSALEPKPRGTVAV